MSLKRNIGLKKYFSGSSNGITGLLGSISSRLLFCVVVLFSGSCASWHQRINNYQEAVAGGNFESAKQILEKDKMQARQKNQILYYLNLGYVDFMLGNYTESNRSFELAENLIEDQQKNVLVEAAVLISNPEARPYRPEDFEVIMINFYKAMNYLQMENTEGALVEVRKINIKLNALNDKYPDHKNRYQRDAFAHLLMGLIFDAAGKDNDAFIAYRNAYDTYQTDYVRNFGVSAPQQLKKDLLRTAYRCGFTSELQRYEKEFNMPYSPEQASSGGEVVFFWLNGFGPVKEQWSISFYKKHGRDGALIFYNDQYGLSFPFFIPLGTSDHERSSLADLEVLNVAFPKYMSRKPAFKSGTLSIANKSYSFEIAENIDEIAFKTLHDRMLREFSNALLRLATKKAVEHIVRDKNKWLGFAVGIINAATEVADTRNWQTLPYSISYTRAPLAAGDNQIELHFRSSEGKTLNQSLNIQSKNNQRAQFHFFHTMN